MKNSRSKNTFSEKKFFVMLREMSPLYLPSNKCTMAMSLDVWIFEVNVVGYVMVFGVDGSFLRIVPEMLGFGSDRSSRIRTSNKNLWEITRYIVSEFHHSTRIEPCKKSLGVLALHSLGKNMPRVPKCQFYPSLKMPRVANHPPPPI